MTWWIGYAKAGTEIDVVEEIRDMGITAWLALTVEAKRSGKQRWAEAVTTPYLPNYIFVEVSPERWLELRSIKYLASTMTPVPASMAAGSLQAWMRSRDATYRHEQAEIEAGKMVSEYQDGDELVLMDGNLAGHLATFRSIIEKGRNGFPEIVAELQGTIGGKPISIRVDPLNARRPSDVKGLYTEPEMI